MYEHFFGSALTVRPADDLLQSSIRHELREFMADEISGGQA
jgi:hypothetical protein